MSDDMNDVKKKFRHGELLNSVDHFVASFKGDQTARDKALQDRADQKAAQLEYEKRMKRSKGKTSGPGI